MLLWVTLLALHAWQNSALGITDLKGEFLGDDFVNYWSGAKLAANGHAPLAYDLDGYHAYHKSFAGPHAEFKNYAYPPTAMLLSLPLAMLPYVPALLLWTLLGIGSCTLLLSRTIGWRSAALAIAASPAVFISLDCGQNGLFTAALMAGGIGLLDRRPVLAGVLFGLLCYKPQLAILLPLALAAGRHWRCFASATVTVICVIFASILVLGIESWEGFLHMMKFQRLILQTGQFLTQPTVFSTVSLVLPVATVDYAGQGISTIIAAIVIFSIWRKQSGLRVKGAALALAAFLATPYAWDYDMVVLTFAAVWIVEDAERTGFLPWEKVIWLAVIIVPIPLMALAQYTGFQPAPIILWLALWMTFKRSRLTENVSISPSLS